MNNVKLSQRLGLLLEQIPRGCKLADIGSDHALLPLAAVQSGRAASAVAGEVNPGPFRAAQKAVQDAGLTDRISVRRGDGLEVLRPEEADCITIAGMGGALIASILNRGSLEGKLGGVRTLLLQPNVGEDILRRWLLDNSWVLTAETLLEEDGKRYEVLTAVPEDMETGVTNERLYADAAKAGGERPYRMDLLLNMGPWLIRQPSPVFFAKWQDEISKLERIRKSLSHSEQESAESKSSEIGEFIEEITEVLACLPKDKP
ncbi:tRNA (adenine(22)-N(1))-methyltransferase [Paenibacillus sp. URB8-2]|uniref:tRNA (adenine(22)-N(1))-methyltransferase n=1 Tax=Paenibacillus sp. URB8-2 TaxID=2741301 RepID=UPI0015BA4CF2|nr:class I SAM-dependent methyltransferase [Paenibacillus sp. URB8-2]BCG60280.1 SAM-dependent methyltransferase [Paenibacillus sp. URB8-2]